MGLFDRRFREIGRGKLWNGFMDVLYTEGYAVFNGYSEHLSLGIVEVTFDERGGLVTVYDKDDRLLLTAVSVNTTSFYTYYRREGYIEMVNLMQTYADGRFMPHTWEFCNLTLYRHVTSEQINRNTNNSLFAGLGL